MKISIVIPAYNEEKRIGPTLAAYLSFFDELHKKNTLDFELLVVLNACVDGTKDIVQNIQHDKLLMIDLKEAGKGLAILAGFKDALKRDNDLIGFVDADMATRPEAFYKLMQDMGGHDGVIASRYLPGSVVSPRETWAKVAGSRFYNVLQRLLFGFKYTDTQCGAKIFKRAVIVKVVDDIVYLKWAFDIDILYQAKRHGFKVIEVPTVWSDKAFSTFNFWGGGLNVLGATFGLWFRNTWLGRKLKS